MDKEMHPSCKWTNRRRMAWASLVASLLYPFLLVLPNASDFIELASWFYMFTTGVVGAYMGFATLDDKWRNNTKGKIDYDQ